jgi:GcrA cell cycle regulator
MRGNSWTRERIELLQALWASGATADAIGDRLGGLSRSAVLGKVFRLRLGAAKSAKASRGGEVRTLEDSSLAAAPTIIPAPAAAAVPPAMPGRRRWSRRSDSSRDAPAAANKRGKSLLELTNHSCRWPHGRPGASNFFFCGAPGADLERGMPYCARHARRAYPMLAGHAESTKPRGDLRRTLPLLAGRPSP